MTQEDCLSGRLAHISKRIGRVKKVVKFSELVGKKGTITVPAIILYLYLSRTSVE